MSTANDDEPLVPYDDGMDKDAVNVPKKEATKFERMALPVGRSGWAIACGYCGLFGLFPILGFIMMPLALIFGLVGLRELSENARMLNSNVEFKDVKKMYGKGRIIFGLLMLIPAGAINIAVLIAMTS